MSRRGWALCALLVLGGCAYPLPSQPEKTSLPIAQHAHTFQSAGTPDVASPTIPVASAEGKEYTVISDELVVLLSGPSEDAEILRALPNGTVVQLLGREGQYALVLEGESGKRGYVPENVLSEGKVTPENLTPVSSQPASGISTGSPIRPPSAICKVICNQFLTLRAAPSTSAAEISRLMRNDEVEVLKYIGRFAYIKAGELTGYVLSNYLQPQDVPLELNQIKPVASYSYEQMMEDLSALARKYPEKLTVESIGTSLEGRDIPVAILGNQNAPRHILVQSGIHAREHMTSLLVMAQLEYSLAHGKEPFADATMEDWLSSVCLHIIPMVNPDGIVISQTAPDTPALRTIYQADRSRGIRMSYTEYLRMWKANAAGVDLNRNFSADWQDQPSPSGPSFERYKGAQPEDQPETKALIAYTKAYPFAATVSYHAFGCCLYWQYGGNEQVNALSRDLALAVQSYTGYTLEGSGGQDSAGYKDWAMDTLGIPSLTIEVGVGECPLPIEEFQPLWMRNQKVLAVIARWVGLQ